MTPTDRDAPQGADPRQGHAIGRHLPARLFSPNHPLLRPVARHLGSPRLWRPRRKAAARGIAIGLFWAFVAPVAQIPLAAAHCIWWRANVPLAIAATLVTNPLTLGFWLWAAYQTGALFIDAPPLLLPGPDASLLEWLQGVGRPVALGMGLFALAGSALSYIVVTLAWRVRVGRRWRQRRRAPPRLGPSGKERTITP